MTKAPAGRATESRGQLRSQTESGNEGNGISCGKGYVGREGLYAAARRFFMSKHHHHPDEGHSEGNPPGTGRRHFRHNWFFYVSGIFILIALLAFIISGNLSWNFSAGAPKQAPLVGGGK